MKYKYCPNYAKPIRATNEDGNVLLARTRCKMWDCPYCAEYNRRIWRARIMIQISKMPDDSWYFWTITLKPSDHKKGSGYRDALSHSMAVWRDNWDKLMKQVRRDLGKLTYVRVFEPHANGTLHVHMMCNGTYPDVRVISEINPDQTTNTRYNSETFKQIMYRYGLGIIHDMRPIHTPDTANNGIARNVSSYVSKYLTKDIQASVRDMLKASGNGRVRMIQTSAGFAQLDKKAENDWNLGDVSYIEAYYLWKDDKKIIDLDNDIVLESADFYEHEHYPNKTSDTVDLAEND